MISVTIRLTEGVAKIEVKRGENVNAVVKGFCETYSLGEHLIKPIARKVNQAFEFVSNLNGFVSPPYFESLLKEAYEISNQPEKLSQIINDDVNQNEPVNEKKRNKSV